LWASSPFPGGAGEKKAAETADPPALLEILRLNVHDTGAPEGASVVDGGFQITQAVNPLKQPGNGLFGGQVTVVEVDTIPEFLLQTCQLRGIAGGGDHCHASPRELPDE